MADTIVITTTDLEPAVRLRDALVEDGFRIELLTPAEHLADVEDAALLVLTGALEGARARRLLEEAAERESIPVVGLADTPAQATLETRARLGLAESFAKPVDPHEVARTVRRIVQRRRLQQATGIVGESEPVREALERIVQIAPVSATVLVNGESGTGKELVARGIHALSPRRHRPFIAANVAALTETLLESELFGHEKGAFTGAVAQRKGLFELAHGGTLFLDEIGEMPISTQSKLLRVLEEREFMRVGGEEPIRVDVRVVAATNQDLKTLVELGQFRRDLYYRLNVLHIELPPLRDRREDIPLLVDRFIRQTAREHDRPLVALEPQAMALLMRYDWPGNVRELRNLVESMVILAHGGTIRADDIPPAVRYDGGRSRALVPAPLVAQTRQGDGGADPASGPALEFVFRTLMQMRIDIEDLRRDFEEYRRSHPALEEGSGIVPVALPYAALAYASPGVARPPVIADATLADDEPEEEEGVVVFRPGMTMQDLEREAIVAALQHAGGNRRVAAEQLGIGERTLYRKIKEYGIPL